MLPTKENKLLAQWQGPFTVLEKGQVSYQIEMPDCRKKKQLFHVNLLKEWFPRQDVSQNLFIRAVEDEKGVEEMYFPTANQEMSMRFCIDFWKINASTKFNPYPMPRIDEMVEKIGKAKFISTLGLCKGYWQITAFRTPFGHYQFKMMPFGLQGAPSAFQRLMNLVLKGDDGFAAAYLDDIIIYSQTWEEHL